MKFDLSTIKRGKQDKVNLDFTVNFDDINYYGDILKFVAPITVLGEIYGIEKKIYLSCNINTELEVQCARCLKPFSYFLKTNLSAELLGDSEISEEDDLDDILVYSDNIIDFEGIIRDQIMTNVPMKALCNENCKGLCKKCGKDINLESCLCNLENDDSIDPRLAKLKELLQQD